MYSSYSPLQRRQLREQTYTDTQSTYLLVLSLIHISEPTRRS